MDYQNERLNKKAASLALLTSILWGGTVVSIKIALAGMPPIALAGIRFLMGLIVVWFWAAHVGIPLRIDSRDYRSLFPLAALFAIQIILFHEGTQFTLASRSTVLICTYPFFTALFAHVFIPGDRLTYAKILGMILSFCGVTIIFIEKIALQELSYILGDGMVFLSAVFLGATQIYTKHLTQRMRPPTILFWQYLLGIVAFFFISFIIEDTMFRVSLPIISALLYQGIVVAGFCFITWISLLRRFSASRLSAFGFLTPVFGVFLSSLLLFEKLSLGVVSSMIIVGAGIIIVNQDK